MTTTSGMMIFDGVRQRGGVGCGVNKTRNGEVLWCNNLKSSASADNRVEENLAIIC